MEAQTTAVAREENDSEKGGTGGEGSVVSQLPIEKVDRLLDLIRNLNFEHDPKALRAPCVTNQNFVFKRVNGMPGGPDTSKATKALGSVQREGTSFGEPNQNCLCEPAHDKHSPDPSKVAGVVEPDPMDMAAHENSNSSHDQGALTDEIRSSPTDPAAAVMSSTSKQPHLAAAVMLAF